MFGWFKKWMKKPEEKAEPLESTKQILRAVEEALYFWDAGLNDEETLKLEYERLENYKDVQSSWVQPSDGLNPFKRPYSPREKEIFKNELDRLDVMFLWQADKTFDSFLETKAAPLPLTFDHVKHSYCEERNEPENSNILRRRQLGERWIDRINCELQSSWLMSRWNAHKQLLISSYAPNNMEGLIKEAMALDGRGKSYARLLKLEVEMEKAIEQASKSRQQENLADDYLRAFSEKKPPVSKPSSDKKDTAAAASSPREKQTSKNDNAQTLQRDTR